MGYTKFLKELLAPTKIYDLDNGVGAAELSVIGEQLDKVFDDMEKFGAEMTLSTACDYGLKNYAELLPYRQTETDVEDIKRAIIALMRIRGGYFSLQALQDTVSGCGVSATVEEIDGQNVLVFFPGVKGYPNNFDITKKQIEDILPCHIYVKYAIVFAIWSELMKGLKTWGDIEDRNFTWTDIEKFE